MSKVILYMNFHSCKYTKIIEKTKFFIIKTLLLTEVNKEEQTKSKKKYFLSWIINRQIVYKIIKLK